MNLIKPALLSALLLISVHADAKPAIQGPDFSGTYDCTGKDHQEGPYTGKVTLERVPAHSTGPYSAYKFTLEVPGYGTYLGQAASRGREMAIHFALTDPSTQDHGTGIASFKQNKQGKWTFSKYYYEPDFKGGNHGTEECVRR